MNHPNGVISHFYLKNLGDDDKVAITYTTMAGDTLAASALGGHFSCFRERYLAGKTTHKGSITATEPESV